MNNQKRNIILAMAECSMNTTKVAGRLHYHRNTVLYHLDQIKAKTGLDPRNFHDLTILLAEIAKESNP